MAVIQTPDYFGNAFAQAFSQSRHYAEREAERKRQEEQNRAIAQMYLESMRAPADAAVSPYQTNAIQSQDDAFRKQMVAESSAMTDAAIANNPNFTQRIQGQTAPVTPEQAPALQQQFQANNQANLSQANNQAQSAEQMLAVAKEKYGTAMFDRLAPIVASGKVPAQAMISIIEKQVQTAEKQAVKQATANAVKILSDPKANPAQKQGVLAQLMIDNPQAARGMAEAFGLKPQTGISGHVNLANGNIGIIGKDGKITDTGNPFYQKPEKPEKPGITFADKTFKDDEGREYQIDSRGQRHYLPKPVAPKDTRLTELEKEEKREMDYLEKTAKPGQFATADQLKAYQAQVKALQQKYKGLREGLKQPGQGAGNVSEHVAVFAMVLFASKTVFNPLLYVEA